MRSLFLGEICVAVDKFKFAFERSFEILFLRVLLLGVEFSANSAAKILNGKIPPSKISSSGVVSRGILLGRNPLLGASSRKISYLWFCERKIPARKISFFEILQTLPFKILQALFYCASVAPRSLGASNFTLQNPRAAPANTEIKIYCAMRAVKFIKFAGSASGSETAPSFTLAVAANRTQAASFTAENSVAIKAVKTSSIAIKVIIAKVANALNLASSRVFARLKNRSDLKEASCAH